MEKTRHAKLNLDRVDNADRLAERALDVFCEDASRAIQEKGVFTVALSGGHTPVRFFELLGSSEQANSVKWDSVHLFWVDERFVSPDSEDSNYGLAASTFLDKVGIPEQNIHRISGEETEYSKAVDQYEDQIKSVFDLAAGEKPQFDLLVLGMGADGHIGSLYPNSVVLFDTEDIVSPVYFMGENINRITLTYPVIRKAEHILIMISGRGKAETLRDVLTSEPDEVRYPVHTLWPILEKVTWLVDQEAAQYLEDY
ncbi:6-phosphogluconolactonase [Anaerohalosphaera lusitana]|uniref:6-phosphogluconolactonase n=1 Tax=Anaerohalosphaera lusitana TaxID=1936003 RepID=A0A1U9NMA2_9BACT|nr:6-phosphogluconolactonase [Anaerohalosphaera lusitana]AQT68864.1 6-phosphogluconolactonase [Anaerohalosphaera lusitana]